MNLWHTLSIYCYGTMAVTSAFLVWRWPHVFREEGGLPVGLPLVLVLILLPLLTPVGLPNWMAACAVGLQAFGLVVEWVARIQLIRANSYGIAASNATRIVRGGAYVFEHPIYLAGLLQVVGWTMFAPISMLVFFSLFPWWRQKAQRERAYMHTIAQPHRGLESFLWD